MTKIFEALQRARKETMTPHKEVVIPKVALPQNVEPGKDEIEMEEEMIALYQTIVASLPDVANRSVMFIGSRSNEGTSTIARQLARTVSLRMEKDVLLVDLDRSRPDLHVYANLKPEIGLDDVINTGAPIEKALCQVEESTLYVMPLFHRTMVAPRTLAKAGDYGFWRPLKERFDLIIVDSPPATGFPDGPGLAPQVDGVILVVEAEKTRWQVALSVKEKIQKNGGNMLGIVFNKRKYYIPQRIYRYL
jgi:Mrp family chromosome partitioning ATPase